MQSRLLAVFLAAVLAAPLVSAAPAAAAPQIPDEPNIVDVEMDANGLNDQGSGAGVGGDISEGPYFGGADFLEIWFTNTADALNVHFHTTGNPEGGNYSYLYRVWVNDDCQTLEASFTGTSNALKTESTSQIREWCGDAESVPGEIVTEQLEDETYITTITLPLGVNPAVAMGSLLAGPYANSRMANPALVVPMLDTTAPGTDYEIAPAGDPAPEPAPPVQEEMEEEEQPSEEPKKKDCSKKKGKAKKKCKKKNKNSKGAEDEGPKAGCAEYQPGEEGAEAETLTVTDEHTAEAPLEITIEQAMGLGGPLIAGVPPDQTSHAYRNVQVDTGNGTDGGLYIRYEFPTYEDHDLYVNYADGTEAAHVGGFNMTPVSIFDGTGTGGHSEQGAEQIDGLRTPDCAGYTVDFSNYLGEGGEYTVTMWLGDIQNDPAAPAA